MINSDSKEIRLEKQAKFRETLKNVIGRDFDDNRISVVKTVTGFGKTTTTAQVNLEILDESSDNKSILVAVPNYENINELLPLYNGRAKVFMGKERAGCIRSEEMKIFNNAGISTDKLCSVSTFSKETGEMVKADCPFFKECGYQKQLAEFRDNRPEIILFPHAFLTVGGLPNYVIDNARTLIIDESIIDNIIKLDKIRTDSFIGRSVKRLTKEEYEYAIANRISLDEMKLSLTNEYKTIICDFIINLSKYDGLTAFAKAVGFDNVYSANRQAFVDKIDFMIRVATDTKKQNGITADIVANPSVENAQKIAGEKVAKNSDTEKFMWNTLKEMHKFLCERIDGQYTKELGVSYPDFLANYETICAKHNIRKVVGDKRVSLNKMNSEIEICNRNEFIFNNKALNIVVLDASADKKIYEKLFDNYEIDFYEIEGVSSVKTHLIYGNGFSTSMLTGYEGATENVKKKICKNRADINSIISFIANKYKGENGLIASTKKNKEILEKMDFTAYGQTKVFDNNLHFAHFGALRGLDYAKGFKYAVIVGKQELPTDIVKMSAIAIDYKSDEKYSGEKRKTKRELKDRNDGSLEMQVFEYKTEIEQAYNQQKREEEIIQAAGRLRAYHKDYDYNMWQEVFLITNTPPEQFIYDTVQHFTAVNRISDFDKLINDNKGAFTYHDLLKLENKEYANEKSALTAVREKFAKLGFSKNEVPKGFACVGYKLKNEKQFKNVFVNLAYHKANEKGAMKIAERYLDNNNIEFDDLKVLVINLPDFRVKEDFRLSLTERRDVYIQALTSVLKCKKIKSENIGMYVERNLYIDVIPEIEEIKYIEIDLLNT